MGLRNIYKTWQYIKKFKKLSSIEQIDQLRVLLGKRASIVEVRGVFDELMKKVVDKQATGEGSITLTPKPALIIRAQCIEGEIRIGRVHEQPDYCMYNGVDMWDQIDIDIKPSIVRGGLRLLIRAEPKVKTGLDPRWVRVATKPYPLKKLIPHIKELLK